MRPPIRALLLTAAAVGPLLAAIVWAVPGPVPTEPAAAGGGGAGPREIAIRVYAWGMSPSVIAVRPGETVRFSVWTDDIMHGFAINELDLNLQLRAGQEARSPAVAVSLPEGTYTVHCSVFCGLGHPAMKARLVVGAPGPAPGSRAPWIASLASLALVAAFAAVARATREPRP